MWVTSRASLIGSYGRIFTNLFVAAMNEKLCNIILGADFDVTDMEFEELKELIYNAMDEMTP